MAEVARSKSSEIPSAHLEGKPLEKVASSGNIRKAAVQNKENAVCSVVNAVENKYSNTSVKSMHCVIYVACGSPGKTKSGNIRVSEHLTLDSCNITCAGSTDELTKLCSGVRELDLTKNNIRSWEEVFTLLECIPKLEFLNLTKNPLEPLVMPCTRQYPVMKRLALNFTKLDWSSVQNLLLIMPNLTELYLSGNGFTDVSLDLSAYHSLELLQLTSNKLSDWEDVCKLSRIFPELTVLIIADNSFSTCGLSNENDSLLKKLQTLNMNNTKISDWNELERLTGLPELSDLRLSGIPLLEGLDEDKRRQLLAVYFPHVKRLNGSALTPKDCEMSERIFLRHFAENASKPNRYEVLEAKHGKLDPLVKVDLRPEDSITVLVICGEKQQILKISTKITIGQLKRVLKAVVGCTKFRLFHQTYQGAEELRSNNRFVWAVNILEGDTLFCDTI